VTITVAVPYYRNQGMLRLQLETWASYPPEVRDRFRFIVVDDASPEPAEPVIRDTLSGCVGKLADKLAVVPEIGGQFFAPGQISLYRVDRDVPWGWPAAKNIAMHHAPDGPALITDIDHVLEPEDAIRLLALKVKPDAHYIPRRRRAGDRSEYKRHPSTYIMQRSLFWEIGGFEERWLGLYGTDSMMRRRAERMSRRIDLDDLTLTLWGRDDLADASTTCFGRKGTDYHKGDLGKEMRQASRGPVQLVMSQPYHRVL
jgi:hypothetical protein